MKSNILKFLFSFVLIHNIANLAKADLQKVDSFTVSNSNQFGSSSEGTHGIGNAYDDLSKQFLFGGIGGSGLRGKVQIFNTTTRQESTLTFKGISEVGGGVGLESGVSGFWRDPVQNKIKYIGASSSVSGYTTLTGWFDTNLPIAIIDTQIGKVSNPRGVTNAGIIFGEINSRAGCLPKGATTPIILDSLNHSTNGVILWSSDDGKIMLPLYTDTYSNTPYFKNNVEILPNFSNAINGVTITNETIWLGVSGDARVLAAYLVDTNGDDHYVLINESDKKIIKDFGFEIITDLITDPATGNYVASITTETGPKLYYEGTGYVNPKSASLFPTMTGAQINDLIPMKDSIAFLTDTGFVGVIKDTSGTSADIAPSITTPPGSTVVTAGAQAVFSVIASGTAPMTYQWMKNNVAMSNTNSASYTYQTSASGSENNVKFKVKVSNAVGDATSNEANLTINYPPNISTHPANKTVVVGQTAKFDVVATGTGTLTYQWKKNNSNINGATSASYTTPATVLADNGAVYSVVVTNSYGTKTSNNATLTVTKPLPVISTHPLSQTKLAPQSATFSVKATGTGKLKYQWKKNGQNINKATSSSYSTGRTSYADNGAVYSVVVTDDNGSTPSNNATLTVNSRPEITKQPTPLVSRITVGQSTTYTLEAIGSPTLQYQWYYDGKPISGASGTSYTTPVATKQGIHVVYCRITNSYGSAITVNLQLVLNQNAASRRAARAARRR